MKTKLLRKLRQEASDYVRVYANKFNPGYEVRQMEWNDVTDTGRYKVLETLDYLDDAKKRCDHYRRNYILSSVREKRMYGYFQANHGRVY